MRRIFSLTLAFSLALVLVSGCKPKVDCDKLETRLVACMKDNYKALNPQGCPSEAEECAKVHEKLTADYARLVDQELVGPCKAKDGRDPRADQINACLAKDCKELNACLKEVTR